MPIEPPPVTIASDHDDQQVSADWGEYMAACAAVPVTRRCCRVCPADR